MGNMTDIKIEGTRFDTGQPPEKTLQVCKGEYHLKDGTHYLTYSEKIDGEKESKAIIKTDGKTASLIRFSDYGSSMQFNPEKLYAGKYNTPYGVLDFEIVTREVILKIKDCDASLFLRYGMKIAGQQSENTLKINFNLREGN